MRGFLRRVSQKLDSQPFLDFDVPIRNAIEHVMMPPHSYTDTAKHQRDAFNAIHEKMCTGQLRVIGRESDVQPLRLIEPEQCANLEPYENIVRDTPFSAAPEGVWFILRTPRTTNPETDKPIGPTFSALRVPGRELNRIWPK